MDFNIDGAKKLFLNRVDNQYETENLDAELANAIDEARSKYESLVGYGEYNRVVNTPLSIPVTFDTVSSLSISSFNISSIPKITIFTNTNQKVFPFNQKKNIYICKT